MGMFSPIGLLGCIALAKLSFEVFAKSALLA